MELGGEKKSKFFLKEITPLKRFLGPFKAILTPLPQENPLALYLLRTRSVPTYNISLRIMTGRDF